MNWKDNFKKGEEIIIATISEDGLPHANIVNSVGFLDGKLVIKDSQMDTTIKNLRENKKVCIVGGYVRIKGEVEIFSSGKYFDFCVENSQSMTFPARHVIVIDITEVFDLDKIKLIDNKILNI